MANTATVNEQCLTATLTGNPPPGVGPGDDDISDNVAELCLDRQDTLYLNSADIREFTSHPCVGNTDWPCSSTDDIRVRAVDKTFDPPLPVVAETPVIQVPDKARIREYDGDTNSVNSEDVVSWQTPVDISLDEFSSEHERWSNASISISYEMLNKNDDFAKVHFRGDVNALLNNGQRSVSVLSAFNPGATGNGPFELIGEFEKLGTYKVSQTVTLTHDNNTDGDTSDDVEYSATGAYIFHVGPIAELEVEGGGASSHAAADQHALTIVAANNGPDLVEAAQVTGLPAGAEVLHNSQGTYDDTTGVWDIGELKVRGYYRSRGEPEPTLVLSAAAGETADVSIANSESYEVCVGPKDTPGNLAHNTQAACEAATSTSWNSTPVYDHKTDNNTATVTAQAGTGGVGEGVPSILSADDLSPSITVTWDAVDFLYGVPVSHYEIQRPDQPLGDPGQRRAGYRGRGYRRGPR